MSEMAKIIITSTPVGLVIGALHDCQPKTLVLNSPRIVVIQPAKDGIAVNLSPLLGSPEKIVVSLDTWWEVKDRDITNAYIQATTGLQMVTQLPKHKFQ